MPFNRREEKKHRVEFHIAGVCLRSENGGETQALIAKRNEDRQLYPGKFEACGGQLQPGEGFFAGVQRHFLQEMGIKVIPLNFYRIYEIPLSDGKVIPGLRMLCLHVSGDARSDNHSEIRWVKKTELEKMNEDDFVPGLRQSISNWMDGPFQGALEDKDTEK